MPYTVEKDYNPRTGREVWRMMTADGFPNGPSFSSRRLADSAAKLQTEIDAHLDTCPACRRVVFDVTARHCGFVREASAEIARMGRKGPR